MENIYQAESNALTRREQEVLELLASGENNQAIALELSISIKTVESHITNIYLKLGVQNRI